MIDTEVFKIMYTAILLGFIIYDHLNCIEHVNNLMTRLAHDNVLLTCACL